MGNQMDVSPERVTVGEAFVRLTRPLCTNFRQPGPAPVGRRVFSAACPRARTMQVGTAVEEPEMGDRFRRTDSGEIWRTP